MFEKTDVSVTVSVNVGRISSLMRKNRLICRPHLDHLSFLKTGRATRPTHSEFGGKSLLHRLPVATGQDPDVARAAGDASGVRVLEPGLGVLAAGAEAVAEFCQRDLTPFVADGLDAFQY